MMLNESLFMKHLFMKLPPPPTHAEGEVTLVSRGAEGLTWATSATAALDVAPQ